MIIGLQGKAVILDLIRARPRQNAIIHHNGDDRVWGDRDALKGQIGILSIGKDRYWRHPAFNVSGGSDTEHRVSLTWV
jgi:hypothetical protein